MALSTRRHIFPAALLLLVTLLSSGRLSSSFVPSLSHNASAVAATSDANVAFDAPDLLGRPSKAPPVLLAGEVSNVAPIIPVPANAGPHGYCVTVTNTAVDPIPSPVDARLGFKAVPSGSKAANVPAAALTPAGTDLVRTDVLHVPTGFPVTATPWTYDQYCAQITAPVGWTAVKITWSYKIGTDLFSIDLEIPVVNVTLSYTDGRFSGAGTPEPARVCTEGWGWDPGNIPITGGQMPFFLTGSVAIAGASPASNAVVANNNPALSDWDWTWSAGPPTPIPTVTADYYELHSSPLVLASAPGDSVRTDHFEHCIGLVGTVAGSWDVTFQFGSIYQPGVAAEATTAPDTVTFSSDATRRLRNIGPSGQMLVPEMLKVGFAPASPDILRKVLIQDNLVRTAQHMACVTQTPNGPAVGPLRENGNQIATVFVATAADTIDLAGAECFRWTSSTARTQFVSADGVDGILSVRWNNLHFTELTDREFQLTLESEKRGAKNIDGDDLTRALTFNLGNGTFTSGPLNVVEWVYGDLTPKAVAPATEPHAKAVSTSPAAGDRLVSGAVITATISSPCGTFNGTSKTITGVSMWGRFELTDPEDGNKHIDDLRLSITNDTSCGPSSTITIQVDVFYPDNLATAATAPETLTVSFTYSVPNKEPRFAWAGQQVTITYAVSADAGTCDGSFVKFIRASGQPGAFLPGPGVTLNGASEAVVDFDTPTSCSASVVYESEDPGEVDIEAFIQGAQGGALEKAGPYSKKAVPIYFMLLEDVTVTSTPTTIVSTPGDVSASVRGFFVGTNPSGRAAETKADGRSVPADRWVMPDDYEQLRGPSDFRASWPSSVPMPAARVTFLMQNESVVNSYKPPVKTGAVGWFLPDDATDILFNINPITNQPSVLGSEARPRIMSELSDTSGKASVDTFGDLNLTYEACAKSPINGNPHCKPDDVVGHTTYYTITDYPFAQKKFPPIISNNATTEWTWFGYKQVTVVNTDDPQIKYVVAHLRDRDGFCDAYDFNNVLGVPVTFEIDAGGGVIIDAADRPYSVSSNRRFATATTFDILDDLNKPINEDIARTSLSNDECQAWIRITNSLLIPTNVIVTFPAPPSPVPGNVRVTGLTCTGLEQITVTNQGSSLVSLAGFSLLSPPSKFGPFEYFGLQGHVEPGGSKTFYGGSLAPDRGWLFSEDRIFGAAGDYVSLVWNGFEIDRVHCDGRPAIHNTIPASFAFDPEGEIIVDITVPFGTEKAVALDAGWNLVTAGSADTVIKDALAGYEGKVSGVYLWDPVKETWGRYIVGAPDSVNTISKFEKGKIYWVQVKQPFTLLLLK